MFWILHFTCLNSFHERVPIPLLDPCCSIKNIVFTHLLLSLEVNYWSAESWYVLLYRNMKNLNFPIKPYVTSCQVLLSNLHSFHLSPPLPPIAWNTLSFRLVKFQLPPLMSTEGSVIINIATSQYIQNDQVVSLPAVWTLEKYTQGPES